MSTSAHIPMRRDSMPIDLILRGGMADGQPFAAFTLKLDGIGVEIKAENGEAFEREIPSSDELYAVSLSVSSRSADFARAVLTFRDDRGAAHGSLTFELTVRNYTAYLLVTGVDEFGARGEMQIRLQLLSGRYEMLEKCMLHGEFHNPIGWVEQYIPYWVNFVREMLRNVVVVAENPIVNGHFAQDRSYLAPQYTLLGFAEPGSLARLYEIASLHHQLPNRPMPRYPFDRETLHAIIRAYRLAVLRRRDEDTSQ